MPGTTHLTRHQRRGSMPTFEPMASVEAFRQFLATRGLDDDGKLSARDGLEPMLDFYRDIRADGCDFEGADMLLFQWGTYDRAFLHNSDETGESFLLNLTRQLIVHERGEDDDIWQLGLNFEFEPTDQLGGLGGGDTWCHSLQELPQFRGHVLASGPFTACSQLPIHCTTLDYGCAG